MICEGITWQFFSKKKFPLFHFLICFCVVWLCCVKLKFIHKFHTHFFPSYRESNQSWIHSPFLNLPFSGRKKDSWLVNLTHIGIMIHYRWYIKGITFNYDKTEIIGIFSKKNKKTFYFSMCRLSIFHGFKCWNIKTLGRVFCCLLLDHACGYVLP